MTVRYRTTVHAFRGNTRLRAVELRDAASGEATTVQPAAAFVFIGLQPNTGFLTGAINLDADGFVVTDATLQTSLPGVFAAGDARAGSTKQLVSAAGEGATAALMIRRYLERAKVVPPPQTPTPAEAVLEVPT
jgi:thioredoxin reductase (NADPH)